MTYNEKQVQSLQKKLEATEVAHQQYITELQESHTAAMDDLTRKLHNARAECNHLRESLRLEQQLPRRKRQKLRHTIGGLSILVCVASAVLLSMAAATGIVPIWIPFATLLAALVIGNVTSWAGPR